MKTKRFCMLAAVLISGTMAVMAASTDNNTANNKGNDMEQYKKILLSAKTFFFI